MLAIDHEEDSNHSRILTASQLITTHTTDIETIIIFNPFDNFDQ